MHQARLLSRWGGRVVVRAIALLLVPAVLLGGVPQSLCLCAEGGTARACASPGCCQRRSGGASSSGCHCACCAAIRGQPRSCCAGRGVARASHGRIPLPAGLHAAQVGGTCCRQQVASPAPAAVEKNSTWTSAATASCGDVPLLADFQHGFLSARSDGSLHLPPLDRVILFLHLTI